MKTTKQRQAEFKKRRKESGLVRLELWVMPEHREKIARYVKKLA